MIRGVGIDILEISRMERAVSRPHFSMRVYTGAERAYAETRVNAAEVFAGMFAAKEAVSKALGTGFTSFSLRDVEILHDAAHAPSVALHGNALAVFNEKSGSHIHISISHERNMAVAMAVIEGES